MYIVVLSPCVPDIVDTIAELIKLLSLLIFAKHVIRYDQITDTVDIRKPNANEMEKVNERGGKRETFT